MERITIRCRKCKTPAGQDIPCEGLRFKPTYRKLKGGRKSCTWSAVGTCGMCRGGVSGFVKASLVQERDPEAFIAAQPAAPVEEVEELEEVEQTEPSSDEAPLES